MKLFLPFCLTFCLISTSCERHEKLKREITVLETAVKQGNEAAAQCEKDIAALGSMEALPHIIEQTKFLQEKTRPLEFENATRERRWAAIETEFAKLKPATEAFKSSQPK